MNSKQDRDLLKTMKSYILSKTPEHEIAEKICKNIYNYKNLDKIRIWSLFVHIIMVRLGCTWENWMPKNHQYYQDSS